MSLISIKKLLHRSIGLNASSIGDSSIDRAVKHRLKNLNVSSMEDYYQLLLHNAQEASELIEEIVVPETWFFRNNTPFEAFRDYFKIALQPKLLKNETIRILSVPCATGEEAYSIAIALLDAGLSLHHVEIDAMDISKRGLIKARRAMYCKNSFRGVDCRIRDNYFEKEGGEYRLKMSVRNHVNFKQGNFLVGSLSPQAGYYDVIFCRNLLIYFDRATQTSAIEKLHRALKDNGVLFVGHAETSLAPRNMFERLYSPRSFGFIKRTDVDRSMVNDNRIDSKVNVVPVDVSDQWQDVFEQLAKLSTSAPEKTVSDKNTLDNLSQKLVGEAKKKPKGVTDKSKKINKLSLRTAERFVNEGKFEQALKHCEAYLQQSPNSAHGYYLVGLINNANGRGAEAEELLRKAIYLDPNHEQALVLCGLLAEKRGDIDSAESYRRRAERVAGRNRPKSA
ncbi:MAG: methyltransferase domain-containing protein [Gammaproteobacteria bacterium]|nr:methyltransferase domain-containing protein [Gammaproteobacteria bacterium]